ncbi:hypothetical protein GQ600_26895 [Phytophthora cactorum]|nr:hypothetical protein GQ600_26895 [Phytophthora cactorum]
MPMMEWEAPIPAWIESISINMDDEMEMPDLTVTIPSHPISSFITCSTPDDEFDTLLNSKPDVDTDMLLDVKNIEIVAVSPVKTKSPTAPSLSPVKNEPAAKPAAKPDKQRGYEKDYRSRMKEKRRQDEAEWIRLETQIRNRLTKRTSVVALGALDELKTEMKPSTVGIRQRYLQLLQEERALRESEVLDSCFWPTTKL